MPSDHHVEVPAEAKELAASAIDALYDRPEQAATVEESASAALQAAAPSIRAEERERLLGEILDWLGSDDEYEPLVAIKESLAANPQLIRECDVPLRLLQALRGAVERFAEQDGGESISTIRQQAAQQERERIEAALKSLAGELEDEAAGIEAERKRQAESAPGTTQGFAERARAQTREHAASRIRSTLATLKEEDH